MPLVLSRPSSARDSRVHADLAQDSPGWALVEASRDADLLVIGSRGLGGFKGLLLGSVSALCAAHAACSTLIVRD